MTSTHSHSAAAHAAAPQLSHALARNWSGAGARLGGFRGEVSGIGANVSYRFQLGRAPIALRLRAFSEFDATNRLEGESAWFELSMPLHVNMPAGAGAQ